MTCDEVAPESVAEIDEKPSPLPMKLTVPSAPATACRLPYDTSAPAPAAVVPKPDVSRLVTLR